MALDPMHSWASSFTYELGSHCLLNACSEACGLLTSRSANLKREEKADRKDDARKGDDGSTEKTKDPDDQKPGPSERSRTTKSGRQ